MRPSTLLVITIVFLAAVGMTTLSISRGQDRGPIPAGGGNAAAPAAKSARDLSKWPFVPKEAYLAGQRGSEWLQRVSRVDGRFLPGYLPALDAPLEGDNALRQAGAALALARAARYYKDANAAALASHALLTLMLDTAPLDSKNPAIRVCTFTAGMGNSAAGAALLVQAIHELPNPKADLLEQADELCNGLSTLRRPDGSIVCLEPGSDGQLPADDGEAGTIYAGEVLIALVRSQARQPAAWKLEMVQKALAHYQERWRAKKSQIMVARHTIAFTEAFFLTEDKAKADFVFEMNDWLATLQYRQTDPLPRNWVGGFKSAIDAQVVHAPPQIASAGYTESLISAGRVARQLGDTVRWERYKVGAEAGVLFLTGLQYTPANASHFAEWYRPRIIGGFHPSLADGNLRLDYNQQAICALVSYLLWTAETP
jgi:hypothetical protein